MTAIEGATGATYSVTTADMGFYLQVVATGTGTDCVALACDPGEGRYAGLHTAAGEAVGAAVLAAVAEGVRAWLKVKADDALMAARPA